MVNNNTKIEWRDIPGLEGRYEVSNTGNVWNKTRGRLLSKKPLSKIGYTRVRMPYSSGAKLEYIHRLVMLAFVGECPDGMEVNHKNGVRHDNRLENLEYATHQENIQHSYDVLKRADSDKRGTKNPHAILDENKVREIRALHKSGMRTGKIANLYGVSYPAIADIVSGRNWKHVE